jgi:hypothetical protein
LQTGNIPIHLAVMKGNETIVIALVHASADVNNHGKVNHVFSTLIHALCSFCELLRACLLTYTVTISRFDMLQSYRMAGHPCMSLHTKAT